MYHHGDEVVQGLQTKHSWFETFVLLDSCTIIELFSENDCFKMNHGSAVIKILG